MNGGDIKASMFIGGLEVSTFRLLKPNKSSITLPLHQAMNYNAINENKINDIKKVLKYIEEGAKPFYETILTWPTTTTGQDDAD